MDNSAFYHADPYLSFVYCTGLWFLFWIEVGLYMTFRSLYRAAKGNDWHSAPPAKRELTPEDRYGIPERPDPRVTPQSIHGNFPLFNMSRVRPSKRPVGRPAPDDASHQDFS